MTSEPKPDGFSLPGDLKQLLDDQLLDGESVLWFERPWPIRVLMHWHILIWLQIPFWMLGMGALVGGGFNHPAPFIFAVMILLIACVMLIALVMIYLRACHTLYAITNHRALILMRLGRRHRVYSYHRHNLMNIELKQQAGSVGSIIIDHTRYQYSEENWKGFYGIIDAADVFALLCRIRQIDREQPLPIPDKSLVMAKCPAPISKEANPDLVQRIKFECWDDETILWQGQPDPALASRHKGWTKLVGWPLLLFTCTLAIIYLLTFLSELSHPITQTVKSSTILLLVTAVFFGCMAGLCWAMINWQKRVRGKATNSLYTITNRRVMILSASTYRTNLLTFFYHQLLPIESRVRHDGTGDLILDANPGNSCQRFRLLDKIGLFHLHQAQQVKQLLDQMVIHAQWDDSPHPMPDLYVTGMESQAKLTDEQSQIIAGVLQDDEKLLWFDKPNPNSIPLLHRKAGGRTVYAMTDKRIILWSPKYLDQELVLMDYADVDYLDLEESKDGTGSLVLARDYAYCDHDEHSKPVSEHGLFHVIGVTVLAGFIAHMVYRERHRYGENLSQT